MARRIMGFSPNRGQGPQYPPMVRQRSFYNLRFEDVQRPLLGNTGNESAYLVQDPSCDHHSFTKTSGIGEAWRGIVDHEHMNRSVETLLNEPTLGESTLEHVLANAGVINVADQNANVHTLPPMVIDSIHQQHWLQIPSVSTHQPHHHHHDQSQIIGNSQDFSVSNNSFYDSQLSYSENSAGIPMSPSYSDSSKTSLFTKRKHSNDEMLEKAVERRQKRMAKNRESAARSRAKKQEHIHRLENEKCRLQKVNCWLKKLKSKMVLDASAGGSINRKTEDEAYNLIKLMADNEEAHDTHGDVIQELSMIQNNVITQQLEEVTKRLAELYGHV
ncbi:ABSCISIC ACID-INSENSITIVE 5-like protein 3 [Vigna radiata var. radiata]|uniref:ABSCISIC ACID-INSENSITIVE 5-like protein 3 n=1 Tax=Vigna radiata var. radiata TaxID=3916 RepID=A0A1S3TFT7_VIGRR|nr:ABSCISIC ACID-INSENSITIVE 5-like protein 3 [Vigna radiata var. radiata]